MRIRKMLFSSVLAVALFAAAGSAAAASRYEVLDRLEDFRKYFVDFQYAPDKAIPGDLLAECYGIIIMRQYKAGFVFGVKGGDGVIMMHDRATGEWSAPAFVISAEGSFGLQIGGQAIDGIILIMNQSGVDMLLKTRFKIGVDAAAAAGPVGRDMAAQVGPGTALLTYSRTKGLYAGASFEGGALLNHGKYNHALYGREVGLRDILIDRVVPMPPEALNMVRTLKTYAVRRTASAEPVPITPTGGQSYQPYQPDYTRYPAQPPYPAYGSAGEISADHAGSPEYDAYPQGEATDVYDTYPPQEPVPNYDALPPVVTGTPYGTAPVIPPPPASERPSSQEMLDAAASRAARDAQLAADAARSAALAAEEAAARAAAARGGY